MESDDDDDVSLDLSDVDLQTEFSRLLEQLRSDASFQRLELDRSLLGAILLQIDTFREAMQGNTLITSVKITDPGSDDVATFNNQEPWQQFGHILGSLPELTSMEFECCDKDYFDVEVVSIILGQMPQLEELTLNSDDIFVPEECSSLVATYQDNVSLKKLKIHGFRNESLHIIVASLDSFPLLHTIILDLRLFRDNTLIRNPNCLTRLFTLPSIRDFQLGYMSFTDNDCLAIAAALSTATSIQSLTLSCCRLPETAAGVSIINAIKSKITLSSLDFSGTYLNELAYNALTAALVVNRSIHTLNLQHGVGSWGSYWRNIEGIILCLQGNDTLKNLGLIGCRITPSICKAFERSFLSKSGSLESLKISVSGGVWSMLLPILCTNHALKHLTLFDSSHEPIGENDGLFSESFLENVATMRRALSLQSLNIRSNDLSIEDGIAVMTQLPMLKRFELLRNRMILVKNEEPMSSEDFYRLYSHVQNNYVLQQVEFQMNNDQKRMLGIILRLNEAGRRYLLDGPVSKAEGVQVLINVSSDLDCIYYHLLENPSLCEKMGVLAGKRPSRSSEDESTGPQRSAKTPRCEK